VNQTKLSLLQPLQFPLTRHRATPAINGRNREAEPREI
jgi:hypothetical protein